MTIRKSRKDELSASLIVNLDNLLRSNKDLDDIADMLKLDQVEGELDFQKKDSLDRFLDYVFYKVEKGTIFIPHMMYPNKRIEDHELEARVIELMNEYLFPEIVFSLLKFFSRNVQHADTNLYIAELIRSDQLITSLYETFKRFRGDIFKSREERTINVKRLQQFSLYADDDLSSPLDAACRFKYILEYIAFRNKVEHIYKVSDLVLSPLKEQHNQS